MKRVERLAQEALRAIDLDSIAKEFPLPGVSLDLLKQAMASLYRTSYRQALEDAARLADDMRAVGCMPRVRRADDDSIDPTVAQSIRALADAEESP